MSSKVTFDVLARSSASGFEATNAKILQQSALAKKAGEDSTKQASLLGAALVAAGSAAIPFAAAGAVALTGLGAAAGTALLAFEGLKKAQAAGTLQATQFGKQLNILQGNLGKLETTAAVGVMPGLTAGLRDVNKLVPEVNRDVKVLSNQLGTVIGNVIPGVITGFHQLTPAAETFGAQLVQGSKAFKQWSSSSDQIRVFAGYAENQLPLAEQTLANLGIVGAHVVTALAPLGSTTVKAIELFSGALRAIPIGAVNAIVPILAGGFVGQKLGAIAGGTDAAKKLSGLAAEGSNASKILGVTGKVIGNLGVAGAVAGVALGGLSAVMGIGERNAAKYRAQVDLVTQALQNGTTAQAAWVAAQNTGAAAATALGLSQQQIINQVIKGQKATETYTSVIGTLRAERVQLEQQYMSDIQAYGQGSKAVQQDTQALNDNAAALDVLVGKVSKSAAEYAAAQKQLAAWGKSTGDAALQTEITTGAYVKTSQQLGILSGDYLQAKAAADKQTDSLRIQQAQMILTSDAAGLLKKSMEALGNQNLDVAQAQTALAAANNATAKSFHDNGTAIKGTTDKAIQNQQAIQNSITAAEALASAIGKQTGSTKQEIASLKNSKAALEDQLRAHGALTKGVQAYIDKLFQIPKKLPPTKVDVDKAAADAKVALWKRELASVTPNVFTKFNANTRQALKNARDFDYYLNSLNNKSVNTYVDNYIRTHVSTFITGNVGRVSGLRAAGGPVTAGMPYIVGEHRPELFVPDVNGRIIPNPGPTRTRGVAQSVTNNVVINVNGGDPKLVVQALERYVGGGGKIRIARGVN